MRALAAIAATLLAVGLPLAAQDLGTPRTYGDPVVKAEVEPVTRAIYDSAKDWTFLLRRDNGVATEAQGGFVDGKLSRIMASDWTDAGKYQVEFYLRDGALLFAYETFEWFEGREPKAPARNFRGLAAWERRSWFRHDRIAYAEAAGTDAPMPGQDGERLTARATELKRLIEERSATRPSHI